MAIDDAYATPVQYRERIFKDDGGSDAAISADLTSITRMIERELARTFNKDASAVARDYYPTWGESAAYDAQRILYIDDLVSVSGIVADDNHDGTPETTWASTDYQLTPLNAADGPEPMPYTAIFVPSWSTKAFGNGTLMRVTGVWGYPAVPEAIRTATIHLTAILRLETPRAMSAVTELGQLAGISSQGAGIIERLKARYARRGGVVL